MSRIARALLGLTAQRNGSKFSTRRRFAHALEMVNIRLAFARSRLASFLENRSRNHVEETWFAENGAAKITTPSPRSKSTEAAEESGLSTREARKP